MQSTGSEVSDQQLVARVQKGDKRAFDLLVVKYQHKVLSLIGRYVRDHAEAEDIAQEAFMKAYKALPRFRGESQFYTWLYRIAVNTAKNHLVARNRRPPSNDVAIEDAEFHAGSDALRDSDTPDGELFRDELEKLVFSTLESLPEELKSALSLRELEGLSYEEIAEVMGCPVGTVRSRIFRAREAINEKIRPLMDEG